MARAGRRECKWGWGKVGLQKRYKYRYKYRYGFRTRGFEAYLESCNASQD